jgi:lipopolysaccharide transport system ATP-binding protein
MSDVAQQGRTVLFVSHNMSAILRLTEECLVIEKGTLAMRAPTPQAVDYYLSRGFSDEGQRTWEADEVPASAEPFRPLAMRVCSPKGKVTDTLRSVEPVTVEVEYQLSAPVTGLRVGIYLMSTRGEYVFTSFDTDQPETYDRYSVRNAGHYRSRCIIPADLLNEGRYVLGLNASSFRVRRYFHEEQALTFTVDAAGAPGMQWPEPRLGPLRPRLDWTIEETS